MQDFRKHCYRALAAGTLLVAVPSTAVFAQTPPLQSGSPAAASGTAQTGGTAGAGQQVGALAGTSQQAVAPAGAGLVAGSAGAPEQAAAQSRQAIDAIRQEMAESRRAYEARMADLERRLAAIEAVTPPAGMPDGQDAGQTAAQAGTLVAAGSAPSAAVPAPATAQAGAPAAAGTPVASADSAAVPTLEQRVSLLEQGQADNQLAMERFNSPDFIERILPKNFTFAGYLRAGYGINQYGGAQGKVVSPDGLGAEIGPGRFGNEPDTYGDLTFRYEMPKDMVNDLRVKIQTTFSFRYNGMKDNYTNQHQSGVDLMFREAFVSVGNFLPESPETEFWAGQRWYYRQDVHMYDYYYLDTSGYGGGVENIKLGPGRFAAAWLGGTNNTVQVDNRYALTKQVLDFRWSELPSLADGKGTLWVSPQYVNGGSGGVTIPDKTWGMALGWIQENAFEQGVNKFSVQYGFGGAYGFGTTVPLADPATGRDKNWLKHAQTVQLTNNFVWLVNERFSFNWAVIGQWDDMGYTWVDPVTGDAGPGSSRFFVTSAIRPLYMLTEHLGVESEIAAEWASRDRFTPGDKDTALGKLVLAGVIRPNGDVMTRPEIRVYGGYYYWGGSMPSNYSANGSKPDAVGTWVFGIQAEMWW